jgi:hypothetical protein
MRASFLDSCVALCRGPWSVEVKGMQERRDILMERPYAKLYRDGRTLSLLEKWIKDNPGVLVDPRPRLQYSLK